jgi:tRNA threonylcarbamoyl adenosine modification protein YeaZ
VLVLALDTATPAVTAGLLRLPAEGTPTVLAERVTVDARAHGELLMPSVCAVLAAAGVRMGDLDAVVCGAGPGPFTGLRVGMVTAAALGDALGIPVYPVGSLDAIAYRAGAGTPLLVVTDARRREVYWASYDTGAALQRVAGPFVSKPADVPGNGPVVGPGAALYPDAFPDAHPPLRPSAATLCRWVAENRPTGDPDPMYLRRPDATEPAAAGRSVLGR